MKRTAAILAGLTLAGGASAGALQEESAQEQYDQQSDQQSDPRTQTTDPYGSAETQGEEPETANPEMGTIPEAETTYGAEIGDLSQMSSEELSGMPVMTAEGEEIGAIEEVGYSSTHQDKVATVNVGGFLGVGEKVIAIPLSELQMGSDESLQTTMSREEIESAEEFDPANLTTEEQPEQYEQQPYDQQQ